MKRVITTLIILIAPIILFAQAPNKISYQAIIRGNNGQPIQNQSVGIKISILHGNIEGVEIYSETHTVLTNDYGLINLEIGNGSTQNDLSDIDWSLGPYFIKSECDPNGGGQYDLVGVSQILSVPFALHANIADSVIAENDPIYLNSTAYNISPEDTILWNNKISDEVDPQYSNSVAAAITAEDTATWNQKLTTEVDPLYSNSIAANISAEDTSYWNNKLDQLDAENLTQSLTVSRTGDTLKLSNSNFVIIPGISYANYPISEIPEILDVNVSLENVTEGTNITVTIIVDDPDYTNVNYVDYYIANSNIDPILSKIGNVTFVETDPGVFEYTNTLLLTSDYPSGEYAVINVIVKNEDNITVSYDSFTYFTITH